MEFIFVILCYFILNEKNGSDISIEFSYVHKCCIYIYFQLFIYGCIILWTHMDVFDFYSIFYKSLKWLNLYTTGLDYLLKFYFYYITLYSDIADVTNIFTELQEKIIFCPRSKKKRLKINLAFIYFLLVFCFFISCFTLNNPVTLTICPCRWYCDDSRPLKCLKKNLSLLYPLNQC